MLSTTFPSLTLPLYSVPPTYLQEYASPFQTHLKRLRFILFILFLLLICMNGNSNSDLSLEWMLENSSGTYGLENLSKCVDQENDVFTGVMSLFVLKIWVVLLKVCFLVKLNKNYFAHSSLGPSQERPVRRNDMLIREAAVLRGRAQELTSVCIMLMREATGQSNQVSGFYKKKYKTNKQKTLKYAGCHQREHFSHHIIE